MYIIKVNDDNTLSVEKKDAIICGSAFTDDLWILLPKLSNGVDMDGYDASITYRLPYSNKVKTEEMVRAEKDYGDSIKYTLIDGSEFTSESGVVELFVTLTKNDVKRKTKSIRASIVDASEFDWDGITDNRYEVNDEYADYNIVAVNNKSVDISGRQYIVAGEKNSRYIPFRMSRFYDGFDLHETLLLIHYVDTIGQEYHKSPINVSYSDSEIRFGWLVNDDAISEPGSISFEICATKTNKDATTYIWKTIPSKITVLESL